MDKKDELREERRISVVNAFRLPVGSKARFYPSADPVRGENSTIRQKRERARQLREMGVSEATIRRRGLDEATLRHAEKRLVQRKAERETRANQLAEDKRLLQKEGPQYESVPRQGEHHRRRARLLAFDKALKKIKSEKYFVKKVRQRLMSEPDKMPF